MRGFSYLAILSLLYCVVCISGEDVCSISPGPTPYKLSVCTMIFNEAKNIEEWLAFHMLLKVDHFYIYNDRSTDNINEVLAPYIKLGVVTLIPWDNTKRTVDASLVPEDPIFTRSQRFAIADCLYNHQNESEWFGVFDIDEFLVLNKFFPDMHAFLPFAEANADDYPIPMTIYGTAWHKQTPQGMVLKEYQMRSDRTIFGLNPYDNKFNGKSLYKAGCGKPEVHFTHELRDPNCRKFTGWVSAEGAGHHLPLTINHYPIKSWQHFQDKIEKWSFGLVKSDFEKYEGYSNKIWDNRMEAYLKPVEKLVTCMRENK